MEYVLIYLLIPLFAVLLDFLVSFLLLNRLTMYGRSLSRAAPDSSVREFVFAIQNLDRDTWEMPKNVIEVELRIIGQGGFAKCGEHPPLYVSCGPGDKPKAVWGSDSHDAIVVKISRFRPWKTWVFRCLVSADVYEMRMEARVPRRSLLRRLLQSVNEHTFKWTDVGVHSARLAVRDQAVWKELKAGWKSAAHVLVPIVAFCLLVYLVFVFDFVMPYASQFASTTSKSGLFDPRFLWIDSVAFIVGLWGLYRWSQTRPIPLTPGYELEQPLPPS